MPLTEAAFGKRWTHLLYETAKAALYAAAGRATDEDGRETHARMRRCAWDLAELERSDPRLGDRLGRLAAQTDQRLAAVREEALAFAAAPSEEAAALPAAARRNFMSQSKRLVVDDEIFRWTDGTGAARAADPLDLLRQLNCRSPECNVNLLLEAAESNSEGLALPGAKALGAVACRTFNLGEPFDEAKGGGVLERRWRAVLNAFLEHLAKNVAPAETTPTSAPSSAPAPSDCPPATGSDLPSTSAGP